MNHRALFCLVALSCLPCVPWKAAAATSPSCPELRARVTDLEQQERVASDAPSRRKRKRELLEARMELGRFCPVAPKTARGKKSGEGGGRPPGGDLGIRRHGGSGDAAL